jgi:deazaflavin-dependent oxidoreductase (nitroreductase family)
MSDLPAELPGWIAAHIRLYETDPEKAHYWDSSIGGGTGMIPTLLLTTVGRKSGKPRPLPLIYKQVGDSYVIIASKGGAPAHPSWYLNLVAEPECDVQAGTTRLRARARTASGEERSALWKELAALYPPYDDYQKSAGDREIPVVVLDPIGD